MSARNWLHWSPGARSGCSTWVAAPAPCPAPSGVIVAWASCGAWRSCRLHAALKPGGLFICSIPNIRNLSFILKLLFKGSFEYKDAGVMDRTHLRFFARTDVEQLFRGAGFEHPEIRKLRPKPGVVKALGRVLFGDLAIKGFLVTACK